MINLELAASGRAQDSATSAFKKFVGTYRSRMYQKGEIVLVQGEVPTTAYFLRAGIVKTYNLTSAGEEKPISFDVAGEVFPMAWTFNRARYAQYYYEAFTDCQIVSIPRLDYHQFLKSHPAALYQLFDDFVGRYLNFQMRVNALEQSKAATKIVNTIHFLCLHFGREVKKDVIHIQLPLTQQDLANFMGLTRETTGIELKRLQRQGVLSYRRQTYMVDIAKLDTLLDEDYDQGRTTMADRLDLQT